MMEALRGKKVGDYLHHVGSTKIDLDFFVESPLRRPSLESNAFNDEDSLWTSSSEEGDDLALFGDDYQEEVANQHGLFDAECAEASNMVDDLIASKLDDLPELIPRSNDDHSFADESFEEGWNDDTEARPQGYLEEGCNDDTEASRPPPIHSFEEFRFFKEGFQSIDSSQDKRDDVS